jgi:hypothetical protein
MESITLITAQKGEEKAQACENACLQQLSPSSFLIHCRWLTVVTEKFSGRCMISAKQICRHSSSVPPTER